MAKKVLLKLTPVLIPPHGLHLIVKVKINNKVARLVLDTGASQTVLDINRIDRFTSLKDFKKTDGHSSGIGTSTMESHILPVKKVQLGDCIIRDVDLVMMDLVHVNQSYELIGSKPVDGVLGGDLLNMLNAVIDYKKRVIILYPSKSMSFNI